MPSTRSEAGITTVLHPMEDQTMHDTPTSEVEVTTVPHTIGGETMANTPASTTLNAIPLEVELTNATAFTPVQCVYYADETGPVLGPVNKLPPGLDEAIAQVFAGLEDKKRVKMSILKRSDKDCVRNKITKNRSPWTMSTKLETCKSCYRNKRICMRWSEESNSFMVLPLPSAVREVGAKPGQVSWYKAEVVVDDNNVLQLWHHKD